MSSGNAHRIGSTVAVGVVAAIFDYKRNGKLTWRTPVAAGVAWVTATLPDLLEPANSPHHRQFFHSAAFASLLINSLRHLYEWEAENDGHLHLKDTLLVIGSSYLSHLAMDSTTPMGLPILGKL